MESSERTIDDLDRGLVERLRLDGRETNRSLAAALGVNEATVAARLKRLEASRVIHVVALTDMRGFGKQSFALAFIRVEGRPPGEVGAALADIPEVISMLLTTGRYDLIAGILTNDVEDLGRVVGERIAATKGVDTVRCEVAVDVLRFESQWATLRADGLEEVTRPTMVGDAVDDLDLAIVGELQRDARSSNRSIASALEVSEGTIRQRLRRMEEARLIRIRAVSDIEAFGLEASATIGVHVRGGAVADVGEALAALDGVAAVIRTLGEFDFVLIVLAPTRAELLQSVLHDIQGVPGVRATETFESAGLLKHVYTWVRLVDPA